MNLSPRQKKMTDVFREFAGSACLGWRLEARDELVFDITRTRLADLLLFLRESDATAMVQLVDIGAVDYPARAERFEVIYNLLSLRHNARIRLRVAVGDGQSVPTATGVYASAGWFEREVFDMFGIVFDGHPDLRRILTDYGFKDYPLRRDFPLTGWTQARYDDLQGRVVQEPVTLEQDYRAFDAQSPWRGMTDVQKRGEEA